jgi:hypothetical protein
MTNIGADWVCRDVEFCARAFENRIYKPAEKLLRATAKYQAEKPEDRAFKSVIEAADKYLETDPIDHDLSKSSASLILAMQLLLASDPKLADAYVKVVNKL